MPASYPRAKSLGKCTIEQNTFNRYACNQDLSIGQYIPYRISSGSGGDLTDALAEFGGLFAQLNLRGIITDLAITDRAGIAITFDRRARRQVQN